MRVLFVGGTGNISGAVSRMAVERGHRPRPAEPRTARRGPRRPVPGRRLRRRPVGRSGARGDDVRRGRQLDRLHPRPGRAGRAALRVPHAAVRLHLLRLRLREAAPLAVHHGVDAPQEPVVAVLAEQDRVRGRARPRLARARLPGDDRPAEPHLRHPPADRDRGLGLRDAPRPPPPRPADHRARRRDQPVDGHPRGGLREGLPRPAGAPRRDRRGVPHHLRRGPDLEPDLRHDRGGPRHGRERGARPVRLRPPRGSRRSGPGSSATRRTASSSTTRR